MPRIEITVAIVQLQVRGIIQDDRSILADLIQGMGPCVAERRGQSVPGPQSEGALERVVVGSADAVHLQDVAEVCKRAILIDVGYDIQLSPLAADISDIEDRRISETHLDLQVVVIEVGRAEV